MFTAVYDVNRRIENLACNKYGTQIAVVENEGEFSRCKKSCVRLYDVGRSRDAECKVEGDYDEDDSSSSVETSSFTFDDRTLDLDLDSESEDLTDSEENDSWILPIDTVNAFFKTFFSFTFTFS